MSIEFVRHLLAIEVASRREVEVALLRGVRQGVPFLLALCEQRPSVESELERELERWGGPGLVDLVPNPQLLDQLPEGLCARLLAFPLGPSSDSGGVDVAAADPRDPHIAAEFEFHLQRAVRLVRAPLSQLRQGLRLVSVPPGPNTARQDAEHMNQAPVSSRVGGESLPPIPLVRRPPVPASPTTARGVAPGYTPGVEPVGGLSTAATATRSERRTTLGGFAPVSAAASVIKAKAAPPPPPIASDATTPSAVARSEDLLHPGALRMSLQTPRRDDVERSLGDLAVAESPDEVVRAIALGMSSCCEEAIVFALRGKNLVSRVRLNYAGQPEEFSQLEVAKSAAGAASLALSQGQVIAAPTPSDLLLLVGRPAQVCATRVDVLKRPALVLLVGGFVNSLEVSRTAERLARAASDALTRILRSRKQ